MSPKVALTAEPIPGYTLTEQIGVGGYGEVWKADAPGGLTKAVKLVYGYLQEQWAACELRSLRRIKEVRHPFLLSLERIEVVDGQLVIVTELADGSLKDRYEECRRSGLPGIPRDELLGYLSDAAEALDYMRERFSLQHLDVKPENLLVIGGRVKVGDFGLVRDIMEPQWNSEAQAQPVGGDDSTVRRSIAGPALAGLTPLYASPELFDGRPSVYSDQYSLAIVHQELLTGVPPFPGETAEQLASQHRSGRPRLSPLPEVDRPIIARALAKDPAERFASCRDLIACAPWSQSWDIARAIIRGRALTSAAPTTRRHRGGRFLRHPHRIRQHAAQGRDGGARGRLARRRGRPAAAVRARHRLAAAGDRRARRPSADALAGNRRDGRHDPAASPPPAP